MAYLKILLLLGIFILGFCIQSSSSFGVKKSKGVKGSPPVDNIPSESAAKEWHNFKQKHKLSYKDSKTEIPHKNLFLQNLNFINNRTKVMSKSDTFKLEMNPKFGTTYDFNSIKKKKCISEEDLNSSRKPCLIKNISLENQNLESMNWRKEWEKANHVVRVHDQGPCSSCWAFSAVAVLEGWFALENKQMVEFSPQQLLDCHKHSSKKSCEEPRNVLDAFKILDLDYRLVTLKAYPYLQKSGDNCALSKKKVTIDKAHIHNFTGKCSRLYVGSPGQNENQLKEAVARYGPVSVSINTQLPTFMFYKSGIYNDKECNGNKQPSHAVTVIGFGKEKNHSYWIIKNSWGTDWGEQGYMRLEMGYNLCGIANYGYFITKANDTEGDIPETNNGKTKFKVGSGSSSRHGTSVGISVNIICSAILSCFLVNIFTEYGY